MNYNQNKLGTYDLTKDILFNRQIYEVGNKWRICADAWDSCECGIHRDILG